MLGRMGGKSKGWEASKFGCVRAGVPNLRAADQYQSGPVRNRATRQELSLDVMSLHHPETIPLTPGHGKNCLP